MRQKLSLEPCVVCDKDDCKATVIVPSVDPEKKHFDRTTDSLDLTCPACERRFTVSIFGFEWFEVEEDELQQGFFNAKRAHRRL
jgi:hypothetical protein